MDASDVMLAGLLVIVVPFVALLFLSLGPVVWLFAGGGLILVGIAMALTEDDPVDEDSPAASGWNCSDCGARNDGDSERCHHCEAPRTAGA